jgi:hypothetical protein
VAAAVLAKLLNNRDVFTTAPVPGQRATRSSGSGWALFKSNMRKQSTAGFTATVDVQSASVQRGNQSWTRVETETCTFGRYKPGKEEGKAMKVNNAFVKGVKALV